jgi:hypothetical protein
MLVLMLGFMLAVLLVNLFFLLVVLVGFLLGFLFVVRTFSLIIEMTTGTLGWGATDDYGTYGSLSWDMNLAHITMPGGVYYYFISFFFRFILFHFYLLLFHLCCKYFNINLFTTLPIFNNIRNNLI